MGLTGHTPTTYTSNLVNQYTQIASQVPTYDTDGNMTSYNGWTYTWNGENRLVAAENSDTRLEFSYDYMGRRLEKKVYSKGLLTLYDWSLEKHRKFVYDGYKLIAEFDALASDTQLASYLWQPETAGLDVPLMRIADNTRTYYIADGNKNIIALKDSSGADVSTYAYTPFGSLENPADGDENPFRFSSEYADDETGLVYYNYRYYSPQLGRWTKRDPIEEKGGENLYVMVENHIIVQWDYLGLNESGKLQEKKREFLCWYYKEKKDLSWVYKLTRCPKQLPPIYIDAPITESWEYQVWQINSERQPTFWPSTFKKLVGYGNPDPQEWILDSRNSIINAFYWVGPIFHPGGYYELRTYDPQKYDGSGNQCVYNEQGKLCTNIPTAGTADKVSPTADFWGHQDADVKPFKLAKSLGLNYIKKYYEVRPIW